MKTWQKLKTKPYLWKRFFIREKVIRAIREFFQKENFHEVETPLLVSSVIPESYLEVFETQLLDRSRKKKQMFLTASPEASIKKLLASGIGDCFEITKSFRNCETGGCLHNPEFTILEWYRTKATYKNIMRDCENLLIYISKKIKSQKSKVKKNKISYQNHKIDLTLPWERISVKDALKKYAKITLEEISAKEFETCSIAKIARKKGYNVDCKNTWEEVFNQIFLNEIEPHLGTHGKPTFIYDYPRPLASLAKIKSGNPLVAERFELYIGGLELANCFSELTDYQQQQQRFQFELKKIKQTRRTQIKQDKDFLAALKSGLPACSGIAFGIDRLVMLFTNASSITDVLLFPIDEI